MEEKRVFNEIEYYLPQLAHLIIHLDGDANAKSLERLAVILSQTSIHTALQLCFMLVAAMEDYQPENVDGKVNPRGDFQTYFRCARLLHNVELAVVFGSSTLTLQERLKLQLNELTGTQLNDFRDTEKKQRADEILKMSTTMDVIEDMTINKEKLCTMEGYLLYKRELKKSLFVNKTWKPRYFKVYQHILLCFKDENTKIPMRAVPFADFDLFTVTREKYEFQFELRCKSNGVKYQLRAKDQDTYDYWVQGFKRESTHLETFIAASSTSLISNDDDTMKINQEYSTPLSSPLADISSTQKQNEMHINTHGQTQTNSTTQNSNNTNNTNDTNNNSNNSSQYTRGEEDEVTIQPRGRSGSSTQAFLTQTDQIMETTVMTTGQRKR